MLQVQTEQDRGVKGRDNMSETLGSGFEWFMMVPVLRVGNKVRCARHRPTWLFGVPMRRARRPALRAESLWVIQRTHISTICSVCRDQIALNDLSIRSAEEIPLSRCLMHAGKIKANQSLDLYILQSTTYNLRQHEWSTADHYNFAFLDGLAAIVFANLSISWYL